jgi:hypothetical protein
VVPDLFCFDTVLFHLDVGTKKTPKSHGMNPRTSRKPAPKRKHDRFSDVPQAQVLTALELKETALQTQTVPESVLPQTQELPELVLPQAKVLEELVLEPLNKALGEENGRLKTEIEVLKERELSKNKEILSKQELVDECKARSKSMEEEIQRAKEEVQRFRDEMISLKEKEIRLTVENEFLKRRDEENRLERNAERVMFQTMMSSLIVGNEDRKRKRNEDEETK